MFVTTAVDKPPKFMPDWIALSGNISVLILFSVYDATSDSEIVRFEIHNIIIFVRGQAGTPESCCFAFTCSHGEPKESAIFQCHVFRCQIPEAVSD